MKGVEADYADSGSAKIETRVLPSWRGRQGKREVDSAMRLKAIEAEEAEEAMTQPSTRDRPRSHHIKYTVSPY